MERRGIELPLLIGGATTSRQHTAVRIAPEYTQPTVHVLDASRVVGVVGALLEPERRAALDAENRAEQERLRALHAERERRSRCCRSRRARAPDADRLARRRPRGAAVHSARGWSSRRSPSCARYIDWTFFFHAWELKGRFPAILDHPEKGAAARDLFDARERAARPDRRRGAARAARRARLLAGGGRGRRHRARDGNGESRFPMLRQQAAHGDSRPNRSPRRLRRAGETGLDDHVGAFAVGDPRRRRARRVVRGRGRRLQRDHGQGARRPARRGVRRVAARAVAARVVRARTSSSRSDDLVAERYRGIRPAFGYPACPDHSEKPTLFALLGAEDAGLALTESCAIAPRGERQRPLLRASRGAVLRGRPDRARPGRGLRRAQGDGARTRPSAGCARTSPTTRGERVVRRKAAGVQ